MIQTNLIPTTNTLSVFLSTIVINSIFIPLIDKEKRLFRFSLKPLNFNQKMKNMVKETI